MRALATMRELDVWYTETRIDAGLQAGVKPKEAREIRRAAKKAHERDSLQALSKLTRVVDGRRRQVSDPPLLMSIDDLVGPAQARRYEQQMAQLFDAYRRSLNVSVQVLASRFRYAGMARKVVGVGSVGLRAWAVLLLGRDRDDPLVLQVKEAQPSALEAYLGPSVFRNAGQRVVVGSAIDAGQRRYPAGLAAFGRPRRARGRLLRAPAA